MWLLDFFFWENLCKPALDYSITYVADIFAIQTVNTHGLSNFQLIN